MKICYLPSPADLPNPGTEPESPALQVDSLPSQPPGKLKRWKIFTKLTFFKQKYRFWECRSKDHGPTFRKRASSQNMNGNQQLQNGVYCLTLTSDI